MQWISQLNRGVINGVWFSEGVYCSWETLDFGIKYSNTDRVHKHNLHYSTRMTYTDGVHAIIWPQSTFCNIMTIMGPYVLTTSFMTVYRSVTFAWQTIKMVTTQKKHYPPANHRCTMLSTSKNVLFPGRNHLLTTCWPLTLIITLSGALGIIKVSGISTSG